MSMRYYELTINTKEADSLLEKVVSYLPNQVVRQQKNPAFLSLEFYGLPEKIPELEKKLKADSLRYMILVKQPPKKMGPEISKKPRRIIAKPKPKVELEEIEKKLEEILRE